MSHPSYFPAVLSVESVNTLAYELAWDIDFVEKAWIIPAFKSHMRDLAKDHLIGWNYRNGLEFDRLLNQWIAVRQGKLNPVPRSYP